MCNWQQRAAHLRSLVVVPETPAAHWNKPNDSINQSLTLDRHLSPAASVLMGYWPLAACGVLAAIIPRDCCGVPSFLGGADGRKSREEESRQSFPVGATRKRSPPCRSPSRIRLLASLHTPATQNHTKPHHPHHHQQQHRTTTRWPTFTTKTAIATCSIVLRLPPRATMTFTPTPRCALIPTHRRERA